MITQLFSVLDEEGCHSCFKKYVRIFTKVDLKKLSKWITEHVNSWNN